MSDNQNQNLQIVLLGPPGAGKGTQAGLLARHLDIPHLASGDLLREHRSMGTELGTQASSYMSKGLLVPDNLVIQMILERITRQDSGLGVILDGFPRTLDQAVTLDAALPAPGINKTLCIKVSETELIKRLGDRFTCKDCQAPHQGLGESGICGACGGELHQRDDDAPMAIQKRIQVYQDQTEPLIGYYESQGKLCVIDGEQSVDTVTECLIGALGFSGI